MANEEWDTLTYQQKNKALFDRQKQTLDEFLKHGAISKQQYDKSLHDLTEKMRIQEFFDIVDENGQPTGAVISRDEAHRDGILHRTSHVWVIRKTDRGYDILLQKRSEEKDSFPRMFETYSSGHIPADDKPLDSALRKLEEELGLKAKPEQLHYVGNFRTRYEKEFNGKMFRDNEVTSVYVYDTPVDINTLTLHDSKVSEIR